MVYRSFGQHRDLEGEMSVADDVAYGSAITRILSCFIVAAILLLPLDLHAQTSTVIGTITYHNGRPAVNVLVSIGPHYRYTDVRGRYKIDGVSEGRQRMIIRRGQVILWQGDVNVSGTIATLNRVLQ